MNERAVLFGHDGQLFGILTRGAQTNGIGVVLLGAGLLYHVGPDRIHVKLARQLAEHGHTALRFDFSGIGDSVARVDRTPFEDSALAETREALDFVTAATGIREFVLIGLCSGADVAFRVARDDARVAALVMINGIGLDLQTRGALRDPAHHRIRARSYWRRVFMLESWRRFFAGKSDWRGVLSTIWTTGITLGGWIRRGRPAVPSHPHLLIERGVDLLLILSEGSVALDLYRLTVRGREESVEGSGRVVVDIVRDTDHVFTLVRAQTRLIDSVVSWLNELKNRKHSPLDEKP